MNAARVVLVAAIVGGWAWPAGATVVTMLDTNGDVGVSPSIAVPPTGGALIAYYDRSNGNLKVARCTTVSCSQATLTTLDSAGDVGSLPSLAIGADGRGVISYVDWTTPALKVAHCNDDACSSATVTVVDPTQVTTESDIAIGADGLPLVAYTVAGTLKTAHCTVADCTQSTVATVGTGSTNLSLTIATNGRGQIAVETTMGGVGVPPPPRVYHCADVPCSSAAFDPGNEPILGIGSSHSPSLAVAGDGLPLLGYMTRYTDPLGDTYEMHVHRCTDAVCSGHTQAIVLPLPAAPVVGVQPSGLGWFVHGLLSGYTQLQKCTDATCTATTVSCLTSVSASGLSLAAATDGRPLVAFYRSGGGLGVAYDLSDSCAAPQVDVDDATVMESAGPMVFPLTLSAAALVPTSVRYQTSDGTAVAGSDYLATSGFLTFPAGTTTASVSVLVFNDGLIEGAETFSLDLSLPVGGIAIGDGHAVGTITDSPPPELTTGDCTTIEGDAGTHGCVLTVSLTPSSLASVFVNYATANGSATAGVDYLAANGMLVFAPGTTSQTVSVSVVGDTSVELDETFFVDLSNPTNAVIADGQGLGTILDDDAPSLSSRELTHGSAVTADLAAQPGPVADQDFYRLSQSPLASYEVVADAVSGDVDVVLERLAEDNATVLQTGTAVGTGTAVSMRWEHRTTLVDDRQHIRVRSAGCSTDCGADDTYRLRAYETTASIPRFNNAGTQVTVLILQNATDASVTAHADFWDASGTRALSQTVNLGPRAVFVLNTSTVPELAGQGGSVTVTSDAPYGTLAGKTVALEPATGFSFDSPLTYRPR